MNYRIVAPNLGCLALVLIALKLAGYISWSWIWVLAPVWIYPAVVLVFLAGILLAVLLAVISGVLFGVYDLARGERP